MTTNAAHIVCLPAQLQAWAHGQSIPSHMLEDRVWVAKRLLLSAFPRNDDLIGRSKSTNRWVAQGVDAARQPFVVQIRSIQDIVHDERGDHVGNIDLIRVSLIGDGPAVELAVIELATEALSNDNAPIERARRQLLAKCRKATPRKQPLVKRLLFLSAAVAIYCFVEAWRG